MIRELRNTLYFTLGIFISIFWASPGHAAPLPAGQSITHIYNNGAQTTSYLTDANNNIISQVVRGPAGNTYIDAAGIKTYSNISVGNSGVTMARTVPVEVEGGGLLTKLRTSITDSITIPKAEIGAAAGRFMFSAGAIAAGTILADLAIEAGHQWISSTRMWVHNERQENYYYYHNFSPQHFFTPQEACTDLAHLDGEHYGLWSSSAGCAFSNDGVTVVGGGTIRSQYVNATNLVVPSTQQQLSDAVGGTSQHVDELAQVPTVLANNNQSIDLTGNETAHLTPAQNTYTTQGATSTTTNPDGTTSTTHENQTVNATESGDTINNNSLTFNVQNLTNTTNNNGTTTTVSDPKPQDIATDTPFPTIPPLYSQKYPQGITGVWNTKKAELMQTGFISGISAMFPSSSSSGSCPTWGVTANLGSAGDWGSGDVSVPCWLWAVIRNIFLLSACFTARKIIVG